MFAVYQIVPLGGKGDDHELRCQRPYVKRTFRSGEECRLHVMSRGTSGEDILLIEWNRQGEIHGLFAAKAKQWRKLKAKLA